jgi:hypothetical protein
MIPAAEDDVASSTTSGSMIGSPRPPAVAAIAESARTADVVIRSLRIRSSPRQNCPRTVPVKIVHVNQDLHTKQSKCRGLRQIENKKRA